MVSLYDLLLCVCLYWYLPDDIPGRPDSSLINMCMSSYGHWQAPWEFDPDDWFGFVYRIKDLDTNREYIGKKQFRSRLRKKVAGRKNRKVVHKPSKWEAYTGSSKALNESISSRGMDRFEFHIESLHETKGSLYYAEIRRQINEDVLRAKMPCGEYRYYNGLIGAVKFRPPEPTDRELAHSTWDQS